MKKGGSVGMSWEDMRKKKSVSENRDKEFEKTGYSYIDKPIGRSKCPWICANILITRAC
jgi:hypothetical protein